MAIDNPEQIRRYHMATLRQALKLEMLGMHRSRGRTAYSIVKSAYGYRGTRQSVFDQLSKDLGK